LRGRVLMSTSMCLARFDEVQYHPGDSVTAYSHFAPTESALKDLVDKLFVINWLQITVGAEHRGRSLRVISFKRLKFAS
jgi:hypothetical protein